MVYLERPGVDGIFASVCEMSMLFCTFFGYVVSCGSLITIQLGKELHWSYIFCVSIDLWWNESTAFDLQFLLCYLTFLDKVIDASPTYTAYTFSSKR